MSQEENTGFLLTSSEPGGDTPVLQGVQASGQLNGNLFELTLRQSYRNGSARNLEVVYTFPLPSQAVLLGFASELNGQRKQGQIIKKAEAEQRYEQALSEGDSPVMLECLGDGLHTANIGNLQPGDELVIELRFAQTVAFEQGRVRLSIPCTIAPRYGDPAAAGLQPQQVPTASATADYPLDLSIMVGQPFAADGLECPTHPMHKEALAEGCRLHLAGSARLDRDLVLLAPLAGPTPSLRLSATDAVNPAAPHVLMAAFQLLADEQRRPLALKMLVDCSGSMAGDSIDSARTVLQAAVQSLDEHDHFSLSRFGSSVEHLLRPSACTPSLKRRAQQAAAAIDADLGGTEMELALKQVIALKSEPQGRAQAAPSNILLLTDGEIWDVDAVIYQAQTSRHRVFVIGLGCASAEGVLRHLAHATGGAAEFVTPGEALEAAARRMLMRMRLPRYQDVCVDWGAKPVWQVAPGPVFACDTVFAYAGLAEAPPAALRLWAKDEEGRVIELACTQLEAQAAGDSLPRMAAAQRASHARDKPSLSLALSLALNYQLLNPQTNCVLVHARAADDKASEDPELHRVQAMLAAGWGGSSNVQAQRSLGGLAAMATPTLWRVAREAPIQFSDAFDAAPAEEVEIPAFLRKVLPAEPAPAATAAPTLRELADQVLAHLSETGGAVAGLELRFASQPLAAKLQLAIEEVSRLTQDPDIAWLLLAHWSNSRSGGWADARLSAALAGLLRGMDKSLLDAAQLVFEERLAADTRQLVKDAREQRLGRSLLGWRI